MTFDSAAYKNAVLIPLAKDRARMDLLQQVIRDVQGAEGAAAAARLDMGLLFQVETSASAESLPAHFKQLEMAFNKAKLPSGQLLKRLLDELRALPRATVETPAFWSGLLTARRQALAGQLATFAANLALDHPLKVISPAELLASRAAAGLAEMPDADVEKALGAAGLGVYPDFEIPKLTVPGAVRAALAHSEFRTVADILLIADGPATSLTVIDRLAHGTDATPITAALAIVAQRAAEAGRDTDALQDAVKALITIKTDFARAGLLHDLSLGMAADTTRTLIRRGLARASVHAQLVALGYDGTDAARLVTKLSASTAVHRLSDVVERLADGALGEARRLLGSIPEAEEDIAERARVTASVDAAQRRLETLVAEYQLALAARDHSAAGAALRQALSIDREDDDLAQRLDRLPPAAPVSVRLRVQGRAVVVSWPMDGDEQVRFTVVRTESAIPANRRDGTMLAESLAEATFTDPTPPVARTVRYSVFASKDGTSFSDPTGCTEVVLPAPADLRAASGPTDVSLSWVTPPEAAGVVVRRHDADGSTTPFAPTTAGRLSVDYLTTGTKYRFSATAVYVLPGGRRESAAAEVDATPRGAIRAVHDLKVIAGGLAIHQGQRVTWSSVVGYPVEIWSLPITARIAVGTVAGLGDLARQGGQRLTGRPGGDRGGMTVRDLEPLSDVVQLVPVTVDGSSGVLGEPCIAGSAPSVQSASAERFGSEVRLSWEWPTGDYLLDITWTSAGARRSQRVTRAGYQGAGGVRLDDAALVSDIGVATVVRGVDREWVSPAVPVAFASVLPQVSYELRVKRALLGGRVTASVVASSAEFSGRLPVVVVLKQGSVMPISTTDGVVVGRLVLDLASGLSETLDIAAGRASSPFWIRLFPQSTDVARLTDPPTSQMRG